MGVVRSREQFVHCGLRKFRHSKSWVYRWYTQLVCGRFVYDTWDNGSQLDRVMVECTLSITHCLRLNLQLHTIDLVRTCIRSFCTVAWQLARFQLTRRIARSLGDSWASCFSVVFLLLTKLMLYSCTTNNNTCLTAIFWNYPGELIPERYKKLSYCLVTARCVLSVAILQITTQQCRNYLYDKSWQNR